MKILFRENRKLQTQELMELQTHSHFFVQPGLKSGGTITLINNSIYVDKALVTISTNEGNISMEVEACKLPLEDGHYYLTLINKQERDLPSLRQPLTGGPFVGRMGNPRLSCTLNILKDYGDIHIFSIERGFLKVKDFFLKSHTRHTYLQEEIGSYIIEGLTAYLETDTTLVVRPGACFIEGHYLSVDKPLRLDLPEPGNYILALYKDGPRLRQDTSETVEALTIRTREGMMIVSNSQRNILAKKPSPVIEAKLDLYRYTPDGLEDLRLRSSIKNHDLYSIKKQILSQREEISRLSLQAESLSQIGFNLVPGTTNSDPNHYISMYSYWDGGIQSYIDKSVATRLGGLELSPYRLQQYKSQPFYGEYEILPSSSEEVVIETTPTYVPHNNGVAPDTLEIEVQSRGLDPLTNYYLGVNGTPNYSNPISTDLSGSLKSEIVLPQDETQGGCELSIWNSSEEIVSTTLGDIISRPSKSLPNYFYIGEEIEVEEPITLYSIKFRLKLEQSLPNIRVASLYICNESMEVLGRGYVNTLDLSESTEILLDEPLYLLEGTYYFLLASHVENFYVSVYNGSSSTKYVTYIEGSLSKDLNKSLHYSILSAIPVEETKQLEFNSTDLVVDGEPSLIEYFNQDRWVLEKEGSTKARLNLTSTLGEPLSIVRLNNSYSFETVYRKNSSWVSKQYNINRPYKEVRLVIESDHSDIKPYVSSNHKSWDKLNLVSIHRNGSYYSITYFLTYDDYYYIDKGLSVPRDKMSVLIDMEGEPPIKITRVEITSVF